MSLTSVLKSWESAGNTETACRLIAAAVKTCKVARHVCFQQKAGLGTSYLSDAYLQNVIEVLWTLWKDAGGVSYPHFNLDKKSNCLRAHAHPACTERKRVTSQRTRARQPTLNSLATISAGAASTTSSDITLSLNVCQYASEY